MATHTTNGNVFPGRTFGISRENGQNDKNGRPYFFEWIQSIPDDQSGRKFETRNSSSGTRHYELFTALDGVLTGFEIEQKSFGETKPTENWLILYMQDGNEQYKIQCGQIDGRYSMDIMKRLLDENFNPELKLRLSPFSMEKDDGGWNIGLSAYSGTDGKLSAKWESDHLKGMPQAESREWKGRTEWDYANVAEWLFEQMQERVAPMLSKPINTKVTGSPAASAFPVTNRAEPVDNPAVAAGMDGLQEPDESSDLPF